MKLVFYSVVLNQHQAPVADEFYRLLGDQYRFVELSNLNDAKGGAEDYSKRPYLIRSWESEANHDVAMHLAREAECCVFGPGALEFQVERLRLGLLSFDMGERWLKQGLRNLLSPRLIKWHLNYYLRGWSNKPLYKLCCSAFGPNDQYFLRSFKDKCYKWGYFTTVEEKVSFRQAASILGGGEQKSMDGERNDFLRLMWVARFLPLKHPEMVVKLAYSLRDRGYKFHIDMYGDGICFEKIERLRDAQALHDVVSMHGSVPNDVVRQAMREHDALLFTSDRLEGWGAVVNEAMSEGCIVVGSDAIGSVPYLVKDGVNGLHFTSKDSASLLEKVMWLAEHPEKRAAMSRKAKKTMDLWSPKNAAHALLQLIDNLDNGKDSSIQEGPCSKALPQ